MGFIKRKKFKIIKQFIDGSILEYGRGVFDDWCVYLTRPFIKRYAPKDVEYFNRLVLYSEKYGTQQIYEDFLLIYNNTNKTINLSMFTSIVNRCYQYYEPEDALNMSIDYSILYMGMVAEENKLFAKLGKRIKLLGVFQILIENLPVEFAANFSKGKKWRELDEVCRINGF